MLTDAEKQYLKQHGTVTFVSQTNYPPFEFVESNGARNGMCIELARWIATEYGFQVRFVDTSFAKAQKMIQEGHADVLTSFFYSLNRDKLFDFSNTMFYIPATIFISADRPDIKNIDDLNGKVIAIQKGDYAEDFLKSNGILFTVRHTNSFAEASELVIHGEADAIIGDEQIVLFYLYANNLEKLLKKVGKPLYVGENSMAVIEGNRHLVSILNKGIQNAVDQGVLENINTKWLGIHLPAKSFFYEYRWIIITIGLSTIGLLLVIWIWNINLRREVERHTKDLRENESFLNAIFDHIPNMIFVKNAKDFSFIRFNRAGEVLTGFKEKELLGKSDFDFFPEDQARFFVQNDRNALDKGELVDISEEKIQTLLKGERILHTQKIPILDDKGQAKFLLGISEDITDKLITEKEKKLSDERLRVAVDAIDEGFVIYDSDDRLVMCNQKYKDLYPEIADLLEPGVHYSKLLMTHAKARFDDPEELQAWYDEQLIAHKNAMKSDEMLLGDRWVRLSDRKISDGGLVGVRVDITNLKVSEEKLKHALTEKETLLKEVHHRVKNNMQVISSMLSLQASRIDDSQSLSIFNEASSRIHAMALIHENLYQSKRFSHIDIAEYLNKLTNTLFVLLSGQATLDCQINTGNLSIPIKDAVPFGLVVTEIITNSVKYAFDNRLEGRIQIDLKLLESGVYRLVIADNGVGLPDGINIDTVGTLGFRLISDIVTDQLEGQWELDGSDGVKWTIEWGKSSYAER